MVLKLVYNTLTGFLDFSTVQYSNNQKKQHFRNWIFLCPQVKVKSTNVSVNVTLPIDGLYDRNTSWT